jgi:dATP pyrophosphohydrolase
VKRLIDVYPYRINTSGKVEFLILLRSATKIYADQWRMIGGKVKEGEAYWQAALREVEEELGSKPDRFWTLPSLNQFYEASSDQIHIIPAFAAEYNMEMKPVLDDEHRDFKWISNHEIEKFIHWPEQQRLMKMLNHIIESNTLLAQWLIDFS